MTILNMLKIIPVYPEFKSIKDHLTLPSNLQIMEDDKSRVAWVSNEAKKLTIKNYKKQGNNNWGL